MTRDEIIEKYLPDYGDGTNRANQAVTALCKLQYKWYNDGDVFDNHYGLKGWVNNISGSANWLYTYISDTVPILERIFTITKDSEYEELLNDLEKVVLNEQLLDWLAQQPTIGSAYTEKGIFSFESPPYA